MTTNEKFLNALNYMNKVMKADNAAGHQWRYCNTKSKKGKDFPSARKQGKYLINCVDGVTWAARLAGIPPSALNWYGAKGGEIAWCSKDARAKAKKYFDLIKVGNKTVTWLLSNGQLCEGDILTYVNMNHANAYIGGKKSFDSGHAYTDGNGEMAPFHKWIGSLSNKTQKVGYIIRIKDRPHYRVQAGAYYNTAELDKQVKTLEKLGYKVVLHQEDGMVKVQTGYFSGRENADKQVAALKAKGIAAFVRKE